MPWGSKTSIFTVDGVQEYDATILSIGGGEQKDKLAHDYRYELSDVSRKNVAIIGGSLTALDMINVMLEDIEKMPKSSV